MLNEKYISKFLFLAFWVSLLGFAFQAEAASVQTRQGCLHLRSSNSSWGSLYKTGRCLPSGTNVKVIGRHKRNRRYLKVLVNGRVGYLWSRNINRRSNNGPSSPIRNNRGKKIKMNIPKNYKLKESYRVRSGPSVRYRKRGDLRKRKYNLTGYKSRNGKWLEVRCEGCTRSRWIHRNALRTQEPQEINDQPPAKPIVNIDLPQRKPKEGKPPVADNKKPLPKDLPDFNLDLFAPSVNNIVGKDKTDKKPEKTPDLADLDDNFNLGIDSPSEEKKKPTPETKEENGEKITDINKAIAKYKKTLNSAHDAAEIALEKEKKAKARKNSSMYREALRDAQQKRLVADSILRKANKQYIDLREQGVKKIPVPVIDLDGRKERLKEKSLAQEKKQQADALAKIESEKKKQADILAKAEDKKRKAELLIQQEKQKADALAKAESEKRKAELLLQQQKADALAKAKAEKQKAEALAKKKKLNAKKNDREKFEKSARRKTVCFRGEKKLKKSPLWAIMKEKGIPNPYRTTWKGYVPYSKLPNGACLFKGVCGSVTIVTKFNPNGTYIGYGKAKNKSGRVTRIDGSSDKGMLLACYKKGKFYIHSRSFDGTTPLRRNLVTARTKSWNLPHEQLGNVKMKKVSR